MREVINQFFNHIADNPIELYSECGLQHEMALFIRINYPHYRVRLEYHVNRIFENPIVAFRKKEIDLFIIDTENRRYAIEFKLHKDPGGVPKAMYHAIEDVKVLEQLNELDINCFAVLVSSNQAFWNAQGAANPEIYQYFNGEQVTIQTIENNQMPYFLRAKGPIQLNGQYHANWQNYNDIEGLLWKYYVMEV